MRRHRAAEDRAAQDPHPHPEDFDHLGAALPDRYRLLVLTDIETGLRWGELVALRPRHVDFLRRTVSVEQTIVEVSRKHSPTGQRMIVKDYPKDDEFRTLKVSEDLLAELSRHIKRLGLGRDDLLFASTDTAGGNPISRNTFRTKVWHPALDRLASTSTCVSMTCATPTPRDCSPAEPTSRQSWSARGTRRS